MTWERRITMDPEERIEELESGIQDIQNILDRLVPGEDLEDA